MESIFFIFICIIIGLLVGIAVFVSNFNKKLEDLKARIFHLEDKVFEMSQHRQQQVNTLVEQEASPVPEPKSKPSPVSKPAPKVASVLLPPPAPAAQLQHVGIVPERPQCKSEQSVEKRIGVNLFSRIGIFVLIVGIGFFVKYAIDNNWINEVMRCVLGMFAGCVLLGISWRLWKKYRTFSSILCGGGIATEFVTIAISHNYYGIFSTGIALGLLVTLVAAMVFVAVKTNRRELASVAIVGGFVAPFIIAGESNLNLLFCYMIILNGGMSIIAFRKSWFELSLICVAATYPILGVILNQAIGTSMVSGLIYASVFYLIFSTVIIAQAKQANIPSKVHNILIVAFVLSTLSYFLEGIGLTMLVKGISLKGFVTEYIAVVNAALFWALLRKAPGREVLKECVIGTVCVFAMLFFPIQFSKMCVWIICTSVGILMLYGAYKLTHFKSLFLVASVASILLWMNTFGNLFSFDSSHYHWLAYIVSGLVYYGSALILALTLRKPGPQPVSEDVVKFMSHLSFWGGFVVFTMGISNMSYSWIGKEVCVEIAALAAMVQLIATMYVFKKSYGNGLTLSSIALFICFVLRMLYNNGESTTATVLDILTFAAAGWLMAVLFIRELDKREIFKINALALNVLSICYILIAVNYIFNIAGIHDCGSTIFSVTLTVVAVAELIVGVKVKNIRVVALSSFGVVLVKLVAYDVWYMAPLSRIITFVLLGVALLVASFVYHRRLPLFFDDDQKRN